MEYLLEHYMTLQSFHCLIDNIKAIFVGKIIVLLAIY